MKNYLAKQNSKTSLISNNRGQGLVEYALILVLVALVVTFAVKNVGYSTSSAYGSVNSSISP